MTCVEATEDEFLELQPLEEPKEASNVFRVRIIGGLVGDVSMPELMVQRLKLQVNSS